MQNSREIVAYTGHLSRLHLSEKELGVYSKQIGSILNYIEKLKKPNVDNVEPTFHVLELRNAFRKDEPEKPLPVEEVLKNAPVKNGNFFAVPKVY
ncbi:MAG TPA: Asp-tRNA(Asn)/Glu-tRNA(Gln) amidotransferase subunit GatC [Candidatus Omnitrophica bacterium]|nr:Asp-tRNA(Asn)/Glu-tRNA(Gln) amidotransferase subunit GatC [Candidatus Omnitrophota bacterium]